MGRWVEELGKLACVWSLVFTQTHTWQISCERLGRSVCLILPRWLQECNSHDFTDLSDYPEFSHTRCILLLPFSIVLASTAVRPMVAAPPPQVTTILQIQKKLKLWKTHRAGLVEVQKRKWIHSKWHKIYTSFPLHLTSLGLKSCVIKNALMLKSRQILLLHIMFSYLNLNQKFVSTHSLTHYSLLCWSPAWPHNPPVKAGGEGLWLQQWHISPWRGRPTKGLVSNYMFAGCFGRCVSLWCVSLWCVCVSVLHITAVPYQRHVSTRSRSVTR